MDRRNFPYVDGRGYDPETDSRIWQGCKWDRSVPYGTLLGGISGGRWFVVGAWKEWQANREGWLWLRIHDDNRCLGDNDGGQKVVLFT